MAQQPDSGSDAPWKIKAANKRAEEYAKIPAEWRLTSEFTMGDENSDANVMDIPAKCGILNATELEITEQYNAISLAKAVQKGSIPAATVATAFCKRAAIAQQLTNCLTETFFDDAIKRGEWLDQYLAEQKKPVGPLHGVPVSIKDGFNYVGVASTLGYVSFLENPLPKANSALVDILLDLGAILYCKTNIPQTLMTGDSQNNVFGRVLNPHKLKLGAGGSSGGEGALVAMRGSILGVGTDIGGSVRIPALCCGTYGFKPSSFRIPLGGVTSPGRPGSPGFPAVAGPLATSFEDLEFFARNVVDAKPWDKDASTMAFPWRSAVAGAANTKIRIGYLAGDPDFKIHPPVTRALETSVKKLAEAGFTVIPLSATPSMREGLDLCFDFYSLDNSKRFLQNISSSGEPMIASLAKTIHIVNKKPSYTMEELFDLNVEKIVYKALWNKVWIENNLDVILCPGAQNTAVLHDSYGEPVYTCVWNLLEVRGE